MTLGYSQKFHDGKPTYFREKIFKHYEGTFDRTKFKLGPDDLVSYLKIAESIKPKIHSIRTDKTSRWYPGMKIHHTYGNRTQNRECFFENTCINVQHIYIISTNEVGRNEKGEDEVIGKTRTVMVNGMVLSEAKLRELAINDGFTSIEHFFSWFNKDFAGVIIHWTNHKY